MKEYSSFSEIAQKAVDHQARIKNYHNKLINKVDEIISKNDKNEADLSSMRSLRSNKRKFEDTAIDKEALLEFKKRNKKRKENERVSHSGNQ